MPIKPRATIPADEPGAMKVTYAIGRLDRAVRRELSSRLVQLDLTLPQFTTLTVVRQRSGLSNAQLARRALVTPQAMNEVLASLEVRGLVQRKQAAHHQRVLETKLTPEGRRLTVKGDKIVDEIEQMMLSGMSSAEHRKLLTSVRRAEEFLRAGLAATG